MAGGGTSDDLVWLTYDEIAERLGINRPSAERRAQRRHWPRRPGNDGKARIGVPLSVFPDSKGAAPDIAPKAVPDIAPDVSPASQGEDFKVLALRLLDRIGNLEATLATKAAEMAEVRETLARREGELDGLKLATEHLHEEHGRAIRERDQAHREVVAAQATATGAAQAQAQAEAALARIRDRGLLARLLNRKN